MAEILSQDQFEAKVASASGVVLVDFFATWCGPCKMLSPIIEEIAQEAQGFAVYKVDIDECEDLTLDYSVMSVPTLVIFKDGEEAERMIGVQPKAAILNAVKALL